MIRKLIFVINFILIASVFVNAMSITVDTNNDGKSDRWLEADIYKEWKKYDFNKNNKPDESFFYLSDKEIVYFITSESFDSKNIGKPNIWIKNEIKGNDVFTEIKSDQNTDGKIEIIIYKKNDIVYLQKSSSNQDGFLDVEESFEINTGRKVKETVDTDKDGKPDDFYYYEGEKLLKEELDVNHDGKIDMWVIFNFNAKDGSFKECIIQKDNNNDGKPDEWHYTDSKRRVIKVEKSTKFDGKIDYAKDYKK